MTETALVVGDGNGGNNGGAGDDGDGSVTDGGGGDIDVGDGGGGALGSSSLLVKSPSSIATLTVHHQALWYTMPMVLLQPRQIHTSEPGAAFLAVWGEGLAHAVDHHHHDGCRADGADDYHQKSNDYEAGTLKERGPEKT